MLLRLRRFLTYARHRRDDSTAEQAALALIEISDMFQKRADPETILAEAKERYQLVLVSGLGVQQLYWKGQLSDTKWDVCPATGNSSGAVRQS